MTETIETPTFLILLTLVVAAWLVIGIRDRLRTRRERQAETAERVRVLQALRAQVHHMCPHVWRGAGGEWVVCSRPHEHVGPHYNQWTGDLER